MACPNGASPLELPITNNTVTDDGASSARGISIGLGNPQQILSLLPAVADYDLFVFNAADCGPASNDTCIAQKGGVFDPKKSSSYAVTTEAQWNGTADDQLDQGSYIYFNDELRFGPQGKSLGFPAFMNQPGHGSQAGLPLGPNSTFVAAAYESGNAPSKIWGLWPGTRNIYDPVDGLLIIGGYDTARVDGEFTVFPTFQDCPTCVVVSNMTYEWSGGSTSLLANSSDYLQIGLDPFTKGISLRQDMWERFLGASQGTYNDTLGLATYDINNLPTGNISVTLSNGYQTTMVTEEIFSKPRGYNSEGVYSITNDSTIITLVSNTTEAGYVASWGMPFLTMNYMIMDHDNKQWKMAPARRGAFGSSGGSLVSTICGPASEPTASNGTTTHSPTPSPHHKSNIGAIVGGVIGGVALLALIICGVGYFFWRARRNKRAAQQANHTSVPPPEYKQHVGAMSEADDTRASIFTSAPPTEYSELASPNNGQQGFSPNPAVNGWLKQQQHGNMGVVHEDKPYGMSATSGPMNDEPLEMAADDDHMHQRRPSH